MAAPRRFRWGFAVLGALAVILALWAIFGRKPPAKQNKPPPVSISAAKVVVQDVPVSITALGAAQAWKSVVIHAQVSGILKRVAYAEGADVKAGSLLAEIDPAPYKALLTQAQGALKRDQALLQAARIDLARYQTLAAQDSIARQQVDTQAALVKQDEGLVMIDQGAVATAQVNLGWTRVLAPVSGRVGVRLVDQGNLVSASDATGLVIINQIEPIAVTFTVPQGDFQRLADVSQGFHKALTTQALSQETNALLDSGELTVADNRVDPATGTVQLKARFANAKKHLWPGQFVNVQLTLQTLPHSVTIPSIAVNQGPKGAYAYVVGAGNKVALRPIVVALTQDTTAVIKSGLQAGETVVTDGQMSLKPGMSVAIRPPASAAAPGKQAGS